QLPECFGRCIISRGWKLVFDGKRLRRMHATTMKTARRVVFPACRTISIALLLLAYPTFARQPQSAGSNLPRGSLTGRITVVSGEGATNNLSGVTVKLTGPAMGAVPPSTVSDADGLSLNFDLLINRTNL